MRPSGRAVRSGIVISDLLKLVSAFSLATPSRNLTARPSPAG
jgi:hypothetical protein